MKRSLFLTTVLATTAYAGLVVGDTFTFDRGRALADKKDDDKHEHKEGEDKHDHEHDEHKGEKKELGEKKVGEYKIKATQVGDVKPGEEAVFVLVLSGKEKPKAVRGWVGVESGKGSIKSKAEDEDKEFHLHHEVSKPMPKNSQLWIEVESGSKKDKVAFDLKSK